ncbi:spermidine/putrescine ABC transporter substrate-binding protein [Catellatospora sp. KI3]|uniref:ABC transporter substrate-binding protein n=1 Tax=Catellatospora sp. KI3 TaxID=3041620 RepID=UPI002482A8EC|nr:spermidine/putrescine ABC transporter substrate-binding protein [Catellatospora sp. KI3]MDI1460491.1 spermidine/putrescine ABC transporter substrate-binding protein [Catellatospora sp. KI3]
MPTRRGVLRGALAGGALAVTGGALAACGTTGTGSSGPTAKPSCSVPDVSATERTVLFSNWPAYIDEDEKNADVHPTLVAFKAKTGIDVKYTADINDNNDFYGKIRTQLTNCQTIERDIVVFTDWMAAKFIRNGFAQKFSPDKVATFLKNLSPSLKGRQFDPNMEYAAPWQTGLTGIAVNTGVAKEVHTVDELLTRADLKGKVTALTEMRDTMGFMLLSMGKDPANFTTADYDAALDKLKAAVASGQIRKFTGNDYVQDLAKGDIAACIAWSGDVIQLGFDNAKIKLITPDEGMMIWSDNMLIPTTAAHASNAQALIDYYYDPKVAAEVSAYVNYVCPVAGAQEEMQKIDPDLAANQLIFPSAETQSKLHLFMPLTEAQEKEYEGKFQSAIGA